ADIIYEPDALAAAVAAFERAGRDMLTFLPDIRMCGFWENAVMPNLAMFAFTVIPAWMANRTRIPIFGIGGGTGNLVRRDVYEAAGGHEALKDTVIDDVALARLVRRNGGSSAAFRAEAFISVRMYDGLREIVHGFTKNMFAVFGRSYLATVVILLGAFVVNILPFVLAFTGERFAI